VIRTIARKGWRFIGEARDAPPMSSSTVERSNVPVPDKPSIAVLAFLNMSGDSEQEYFVDGMVEEIITALTRIRWLFVIARNSTLTYKGQAIDVKRVGRELGVRYVLAESETMRPPHTASRMSSLLTTRWRCCTR
jgi:TolB-like protein